jgi:SAM-dependent methyltransferase
MIIPHRIKRQLTGLRRNIYGLRQYFPILKETHKLELMVGPLGYWKELQAYQLNVLVANGLKPNHRLLDIGCGPLQGGIAFIKYLENNNYFGVDIKKESLEAGLNQVKKYKLNNKNPHITLSDKFARQELTGIKFDFVWASQVLYYFDDQKLMELMDLLSVSLKDDGKFLGDIIGPKHYEFKFKEHNWFLHTTDSLNKIAENYKLKVQNLGEIEKYGYPRRLSLKTNNLILISRA